MIQDMTNGALMRTLAWALNEDAKRQDELSDARGHQGCMSDPPLSDRERLLVKLVRQLRYLHEYGTTVHPCAPDTCNPNTCNLNRKVPDNCRVTLTEDRHGDKECRSFGVVWAFKRKDAPATCIHRYAWHRSSSQECECYAYFMNGGLIYFESDKSWSVHT